MRTHTGSAQNTTGHHKNRSPITGLNSRAKVKLPNEIDTNKCRYPWENLDSSNVNLQEMKFLRYNVYSSIKPSNGPKPHLQLQSK